MEDIPLLVQEIAQRYQGQYGSKGLRLTEAAMQSLQRHRWPGNVRELANLIERLLILFPDHVIDVSDLPEKYRHVDGDNFTPDYPDELLERQALIDLFGDEEDDDSLADHLPAPAALTAEQYLPEEGIDLKQFLADLEVNLIRQALERSDWVVSKAAEMLSVRRTTLVEKMRKYAIQK